MKNKYPTGGTGGWNLKTLPNLKPQVEPVEENSIRDTETELIESPNLKKHGLIENIKEKKWIVLGLVAVAGFFAYKKFKK
ncbi:MAG: hypothetical protein P1U44_15065 [Vicingaceae bacterium]|nr:hypothetical protein [Vicingaceae bacterium]